MGGVGFFFSNVVPPDRLPTIQLVTLLHAHTGSGSFKKMLRMGGRA